MIFLQTARDPVHASIGLLVVLLGFPFAGWVLSDRRSAARSAISLIRQMKRPAPDSTLDEPSAVPSIGTHS